VTVALHVLLPTMGSAGDVHPFIALGLALKARGHRATILTNPIFQELIEAQGLGYLRVGTADSSWGAAFRKAAIERGGWRRRFEAFWMMALQRSAARTMRRE
jgi:UDP:flavonoid glycosyltransferase YjiC (YdhE family)